MKKCLQALWSYLASVGSYETIVSDHLQSPGHPAVSIVSAGLHSISAVWTCSLSNQCLVEMGLDLELSGEVALMDDPAAHSIVVVLNHVDQVDGLAIM